jgi:hypothetical protein
VAPGRLLTFFLRRGIILSADNVTLSDARKSGETDEEAIR